MNERDTIPPAEKLAQFEEPWNMARVAKLLGIGLEPENKRSTLTAAGSQEQVRCPDPAGNGDPDMGPVPVGSWATEDQDEWTERREAFSNEGEALDDMLDNWEVEP